METGIFAAEALLIELLIIISIVAVLVRRIRLPYTVALVLVGLGIAVLPTNLPAIALTPDLILFIFLPPLVFEAAFHLDVQELRENLPAILILAIIGVGLSTVVVGGLVAMVGVPLAIALVFGALISATDPVAVIAIFKDLGVPRRLSHIVEGESLLNDGTAIVITGLLVTIVTLGEFNLAESIVKFLEVTIGGTLTGAVIGLVAIQLMRRIDDYLVEITITTIVAFGTYLAAEQFHFSGVIAVVAAGVLIGNFGGARSMSATTRIVLEHFWEYVTFLANSFVFLLIGLDIDLQQLSDNLVLIGVAIVAVLAGRAISIYVLGAPIHRLVGHLPIKYRHVLFWGGLRGAIGLALALALPALEGWRTPLVTATFGVVLFTLLIQGTTIQWLLSRLGLTQVWPDRHRYETIRGRLVAVQAAHQQLRTMNRAGALSESVWQELDGEYQAASQSLANEIHELYEEVEVLKEEELVEARGDGLRSQRTALQDLLRRGLLSEHAYEELMGEIDQQRASLQAESR